VEGDARSRLHEIVDQVPEQELALACQLLELLIHGGAALRAGLHDGTPPTDGRHDDDDDDDEASAASPETIAKLAKLSDEELMRLDDLLESDREGARQFWRQRFGEELPDGELAD
jgi:hypothetical protein